MIGVMHISGVAADLDRALAGASPTEIIATAVDVMPQGRLAVVSSFGTESAVLLKFVADVDRATPVLFIDTGWLFEETLVYREDLTRRLGLSDVRVLRPDERDLAAQDTDGDLWVDQSKACCEIRKVLPLKRALSGFDGWINGRKRYHGFERERLRVVEQDGQRIKFNPLAQMSKDDLDQAFETFDLPRHPLQKLGFASVGCMPCTSRVANGENVRAGRWRDSGRTECGIHTA